jgi:hypothetical protein
VGVPGPNGLLAVTIESAQHSIWGFSPSALVPQSAPVSTIGSVHRIAQRGLDGWFVAVIFALTSACTNPSAGGQPSIALTAVPQAAEGGSGQLAPIAGRVSGARPGQRIVLFAKSGVWWVQPFVDKPFTDIASDGTWTAKTHSGLEYAALLVEPAYQPSPTSESLPVSGGLVVAVTTKKGSGSYTPPPPKRLTFSRYEWEVRQTPSDRAGPNDYDARNAWVDDRGMLHLLLTERDGRWTSAEVKLTRSLGYGTYRLVVRDTSHLDPAAALGFLTWDELGTEQNHRELDVEVSRWGNADNKDVQYVVQPHYVAANVYRFDQPAGRLTHAFRWEPDRALFQTLRPDGTLVARREFTSGVPVSGSESVRINLLYYRGSAKPPSGSVEVVIEKFEYLP